MMSLLKASQFDEASVLRALQLRDLSDLCSIDPRKVDVSAVGPERLRLLIRLFFLQEARPPAEVESLLDGPSLDALRSLDVVRRGQVCAKDGRPADAYFATVFLYPVAGFLVASDRIRNVDDAPFNSFPEILFPGVNEGTLHFLRLIPDSPVADALDVCSGTGIGALALSRSCGRVVASDITARATHFAEFNRRLNDRTNVETVCSDLYSALDGCEFDRIVAHPPYVPSLSDTLVFRDGGETGETLVQGIVEGLPRHLRHGGACYVLCMGLDTRHLAFEERAREWLGAAREEFDVILGWNDELTPKQYAEIAAGLPGAEPSANDRWKEIFRRREVRGLVYGALVIHRKQQSNRASSYSMRIRLSGSTSGADFESLLRWQTWRRQSGALEHISRSKPRLSPELRVRVTHEVENDRLMPKEFLLEIDRPFRGATKVDSWVVEMMAQFDGNCTPAALHARALELSLFPTEFTLEKFMDLVAILIDRGYLRLNLEDM
jgi:SAM-dependent methyltransferase